MNCLIISNDFNHIIQKMEKIPSNELINLTNQTIEGLFKNDYKHINLQSLTNKLSMPLQEVEDLFGILLMIIRWCHQFRSQSEKEIKSHLVEQGFSNDWVLSFLPLVLNSKDDKVVGFNRYVQEIDRFSWRIDISLNNSTLKKKIPPIIFWSITLKDGRKYIVEINIRKFHEIRFNVSTILKELNVIKNNSLLKK